MQRCIPPQRAVRGKRSVLVYSAFGGKCVKLLFLFIYFFFLQNISFYHFYTSRNTISFIYLRTSLTHAFKYGIWLISPGFRDCPLKTLDISSYNRSWTSGLCDSWYNVDATAFDVWNCFKINLFVILLYLLWLL